MRTIIVSGVAALALSAAMLLPGVALGASGSSRLDPWAQHLLARQKAASGPLDP